VMRSSALRVRAVLRSAPTERVQLWRAGSFDSVRDLSTCASGALCDVLQTKRRRPDVAGS
jgi:hypothetical protein